MRWIVATAFFFSLTALGAAQERPAIGAPIGKAGELTFKDIRFLPRTLDDFGEKRAWALVFITRQCPVALRYLPEVKRLAASYAERGVQFIVVDVDPESDVVGMAAFAIQHDLPTIVQDADGSCARALGIRRTPEVALLDGERILRYRGRIDDRIRLGGAKPKPKRRDLALALDDLLAGRAVSLAETPVDGCVLTPPQQPSKTTKLTYTRDVAPLMQRHCQDCHRSGGSAPFSLTTARQVRRHGEMIGEVVAERRMPPWFATGGPDTFANHRGMTPSERRRIIEWVRAGMPEGAAKDLPPPRTFPQGKWTIGEPDLVLRMPESIKVMPDGYMPYQYVMLKHRFERDTWVQKIEIVSDNPEVLHHCNLFFLRPGKRFESSQVVCGKVPGGGPLDLDDGVAVLVPKGALLGLQIHYQPNGLEVQDRVSIGLRFPKAPVLKRFRSAVIENRELAIPPGAPHHPVSASITLDHDVVSGGVFGHMHLRGKDVTFRATPPGGPTETLLQVPNYNFDWQMAYAFKTPKRLPKGTRIDVVAHFDNSAFNPYNPDATKTVQFGLQTLQEMMYCFLFYVREDEELNIRVDPKTGYALN